MSPENDDLVCQCAVEHVTDYLEGDLDWPVRRRFERHLERCPHCARYLNQMQMSIATLGRLKQEPIARNTRNQLVELYQHCRDE